MGEGGVMTYFILRISLAGLLLSTLTGCIYQQSTQAEQAWESDLQLRQQAIKRCQDVNLLYANLAGEKKMPSPIYQYAPGKACPTG